LKLPVRNARHDLAEDGLPGVHPASDPQKRPPCSNREQALNAPTPYKNVAYITLSPTKWDSIGAGGSLPALDAGTKFRLVWGDFAGRFGRNGTLGVTNAMILVSAGPVRSHRQRLLRERVNETLSLLPTPGGLTAKAANTNRTQTDERNRSNPKL
jgi:hypothetical protein